jgi:spermidine/putrescine transport system ATP-binding protein
VPAALAPGTALAIAASAAPLMSIIDQTAPGLASAALAATAPRPDLELRGVSKSFGKHVALEALDLTVARGEFVAIRGPSGCGKTTLLRIVAGLETADAGSIRLRGRPVEDLPVHKRSTRLVWQTYALFPHLNVARNIAFGLTLQRHSKAAIRAKVAAIAELVQLSEFLDRRVTQLSGGQKQRVAIARALVTEPEILLLDEPLSALDAHLRVRMQSEMKRLQQKLGISFVYVTHNQSEAFSMADRVVVMNRGHVEQIGSPEDIYARPMTRFVAEFVGANNILDGTVVDIGDEVVTVDCAFGPAYVTRSRRALVRGAALSVGDSVSLVVQAGKVRRESRGGRFENRMEATLTDREFTGSQVIYFLTARGGGEIRMITQEPFGDPPTGTEMPLTLFWSPDDVVILGPSIVPGPQNVPGAPTYFRLGG